MSESGLSPKLKDLLHREAHLKLYRARLAPLLQQKEFDLRSLQVTRPPFMATLLGRKQGDYQANLAKAEETATRLRQQMQALDLCEPHLAKMIEQEIEFLLREDCPEYIQALAALRQKEDWLRCLERFGGKIFEFTRAIGNVRNLACSGYARFSNAYSEATLQAFTLAYQAAEIVDEEVKFANRIADVQLEALRATGLETKPLPHLPETNLAAWVNNIKGMPLAEAQGQFDTLIDSTKVLHDSGVPELRAQADQVQAMQDTDVRNFLSAAWEQFRAEVAPEIFPGDTERVFTETENMLSTAARTSVRGRL